MSETYNTQRGEEVGKVSWGRGEMVIMRISKILVPGSNPGVPASWEMLTIATLSLKE